MDKPLDFIEMKINDALSEIPLGNYYDAIFYLEDAIYELRKLENAKEKDSA
jgi:hypothetical protein